MIKLTNGELQISICRPDLCWNDAESATTYWCV